MGDIARILNLVKPIAPWDSVTNPEGILLYKLAKKCKQGCIVEIGSWKGRSTIWLAAGSKKGHKATIYAIDPHKGTTTHAQYMNKEEETFEEFILNISMAEVKDIVEPLQMTSEKASRGWKPAVGLIFIDGSHEYDAIKLDFLSWSPYLLNGGIITLHDAVGYDGPHRVAIENLFKSRRFAHIGMCHKIIYARKVTRCDLTQLLWKLILLQIWRLYAVTYTKVAKIKVGLCQRKDKK